MAICAGNSPVPGEFPAQRPALMFSLICTRLNGWVNNGEAGDLRRHRAHYDVIVMDTRNQDNQWVIGLQMQRKNTHIFVIFRWSVHATQADQQVGTWIIIRMFKQNKHPCQNYWVIQTISCHNVLYCSRRHQIWRFRLTNIFVNTIDLSNEYKHQQTGSSFACSALSNGKWYFTNLPLAKMATIPQMIFSDAILLMKILYFV